MLSGKALQIKNAPFNTYMGFLAKFAEDHMDDEEFRESLYMDLDAAPQEYRSVLLEWPIIPVYDQYGGTRYIIWEDEKIFVKPIQGEYLDGGSEAGWLHANNVVCGS